MHLGFDKRILNNNAAYMDGWINALREEPKFIVSVMADVNKASKMILEKIDEQKIALGETSDTLLLRTMRKVGLDKAIDICQAGVAAAARHRALGEVRQCLHLQADGRGLCGASDLRGAGPRHEAHQQDHGYQI
jgi:hypothetical protein